MKYLVHFLLTIVAVFAPAKAVIITTGVLIASDLLTGIWAAWSRGEPITSAGFRRSVTKMVVYEIAVLLAFLTQTYLTGEIVPVLSLVSCFIGLTEMKSIIENLNDIAGGSLLKSLLKKLDSDNYKQD